MAKQVSRADARMPETNTQRPATIIENGISYPTDYERELARLAGSKRAAQQSISDRASQGSERWR